MPALKDEVGPARVRELVAHLAAAWPAFPTERFVERATDGLEELELKGRLRHLATALQATLPDEPTEVAAIVDRALEAPSFAGWCVWPVTELLGRLGPDDPATAVGQPVAVGAGGPNPGDRPARPAA